LLAIGPFGISGIRLPSRKKVVRSPMVTIFSMCAFLRYWAGLYGDKADEVCGGADQLLRKATEMARMTSMDVSERAFPA
jgi:hypothetical protein